MCSDDFVVEHNGCQSLPFFFVNDILMRQALVEKIPIFLVVDQIGEKGGRIGQLFTASESGYRKAQRVDPETIALIFHGVMQRPQFNEKCIEELSDVIDLVLMNSASHRQSLDPNQKIKNDRLAFYQDRAKQMGCTLENPSLLLINHAFCMRIGHEPLLKLDGAS